VRRGKDWDYALIVVLPNLERSRRKSALLQSDSAYTGACSACASTAIDGAELAEDAMAQSLVALLPLIHSIGGPTNKGTA
jgi:hypothetical protein